jgi:hypothetical protein
VGLNQIAAFEGKVASGNGEQTLSRDIYRLGQLFDFFRMCSFFFTTVGYYFTTMVYPFKPLCSYYIIAQKVSTIYGCLVRGAAFTIGIGGRSLLILFNFIFEK